MSSWNSLFPRSALAVAAVAVVSAAPVFAQNTTAGVSGRVTAADGKPVAGATVSITHVESGSTTTTTTDAEGRYTSRGLRPGGPYTIVISKGGQTDKQEGVQLSLAETLRLDSTLGAAAQSIVITGRAVSDKFNRANMGSGTNIGSRELAAQGSINRNLQDYARNDPRLSQTDKERGEISAAGQNSRYNSITIDGVTISDTFGLESNNLPTAKQPISIDAIQSVQVNISNYDVTQKGYTGANINAVTKSGTNDFSGNAYYVFRNQDWVGLRFNKTTETYFSPAPFKETTVGFTFGGPIIKDTLFFFASYEELKSNRAQPEFGPIGSSLPNVAITQSAIDATASIAKSRYGFDTGVVFDSGLLTVKDALIKLDWNINDNHRVNLRYTKTDQSDTNNGAFGAYSPTGLQLTSQWWLQKKTIETAVVQWFADWTTNFSTEVKLSNRDYNSVPQNNSFLPAMALQFSGPAPAGTNSGNRFLNFGTEQSRHFNVLETQTIDAYAGATWTLGDHEVKFGVDVNDNTVYNAFFQNTYGNYTFGCTSSTALITYNLGTVNCGTDSAARIEQAVLENFSRGRPNSFQVQVPKAGKTLDDGIAKWTLRDTGVFVQNTWKVSKALTLTGGVRLDLLSTADKPQANAAAAAPTVVGNITGTTVTRNTGGFGRDNSVTVDGEQLVQPRLGFNWNLGDANSRRMQVRGGVGLFQGAAANVWLSNPYSNTGLATEVIGCGIAGFAACNFATQTFNPDPKAQPTFTGQVPASNVDFIEAGLSQPSVWKANLAFETELPWAGLVASAEWMHTKTNTGIFYRHLNLGNAARLGPDGRELYYTPQAYNAACWNANGGSITTGACAGLRSRAMSNASFNNVLVAAQSKLGGGDAITLSLSQPARDGFSWNAAYTRTKATEVSPLTSSVSNSNFNARAAFNPNEEVAATSASVIKDRINAGINFSRALAGNYRTTFGLFLESRVGRPYSWTYRNDLNGDGVAGNDLMYIPSGPGSGDVEFAGATAAAKQANEDRFWSIVNANPELSAAKGGVVGRNTSRAQWVNTFDLRVSQEVPGFVSGHKGVFSIDFFNVGNFLNNKWGRTEEMAFSGGGGNRRTFVSYGGLNAAGKYVYIVGDTADDFSLKQARGESQWAVQVTLKYQF
jgi:hypothetical protein